MMKVVVNFDLCNGDGLCVEVCPVAVYAFEEGKPVIVQMENCTGCQVCVEQCPTGAITVEESP